MENTIRSLVDTLVRQLVGVVEADIARRAQSALSAALKGTPAKGRPGRPPKATATVAASASAPTKRRPKQLCPVPGCKGLAAPVFGMVCAKHKDLPKAEIKKYREARREAKRKSGK